MTLTPEDVAVLTKPFGFEEHEFLSTYAYIREDAITARIEQVDPAWSFAVASDDTIEDAAVVRGVLTIKDVSRTSNGGGTVQREKWNKDKKTYETLNQDAVAENVANAHKGALTDALKRCARLFGIGRYLLNAPKLKADWGGNLDRASEQEFRKFLTSLGVRVDPPLRVVPPITPVITSPANGNGKPVQSVQTFASTAAYNDWNLQMKAKYPRYAADGVFFDEVFGVDRISLIVGTEADAEKKIREWLAEMAAQDGHPEEADMWLSDEQPTKGEDDALDRHFGVKPVGDLYLIESVQVQKERGSNNFSYILKSTDGTNIHIYSGQVFRDAGLNPDPWKQDGHVEHFKTLLEARAMKTGDKWTVNSIVVGMPV